MDNYVIMHCHDDTSNGVTNIDSVTKYYEYVEYAKSLGMSALGLSQHGSVFEWVHKKNAIEKAGMKYIHEQEFYITENLAEKVRDNYHCILIAANYKGVQELNLLSSKAFNREDGHFYYVPRITLQELIHTSDNIIISTACIGGILYKGNNKVKKSFLDFLIRNKHRCYLETQHHLDDKQVKYNQYLAKISDKYGIPLIAGTDTHCLNDEHKRGRSILQKSKNIRFDNEDSWDLTFKTLDELVDHYKKQNALPSDYYLEAINNTNKMADRIEEFELDYGAKYPKLYDDSNKAIKEKIKQGIKWRGIDKYDNYEVYKQRIKYELETYEYNGAVDFLLLEEDYKSNMRKNDIEFGYSRGSVSGSIVAYILGITDVDSIKFNLNFERFMNKERVSLADIDTDWYSKDRGKVREYLYQKEGLYCCDIITFNTIALKGAIKDVGRGLDLSIQETQLISDAVYQDENGKFTIDEEWRNKYPELFNYVDIVNGTIVSVGNHPAGLVVSPFPIDEYFGTFTTGTNQYPISQINMKEVDSLNFVKLDVLGLDNVGLINETCKMIGIDRFTPDNVDYNDINVWNSIRDDCTLIFQFESDSGAAYVKQLFSDETIANIRAVNPNFSYIDLMSMANGAIRPAGASYRDQLAKGIFRDNGHKALNDFLASTLSYLVYQEQIMDFLHSFCGYTMGQADIVRRGFAKKSGTEKFIPDIKKGFNKTMLEKYGVQEEESNILIENFIKVIEDASSYLFSFNHALPYSFIGYICGYLRYYYPLEFLTAALNIFEGKEDKTLSITEYARKVRIPILPIKFRHSTSDYTYDKKTNSIYKGIASIKFLNDKVADSLQEVKDKDYNNFIELLIDIKDMPINSKQLDILVKLNFFEEFGEINTLLKQVELFNNIYDKKQFKKDKLDELEIPLDIITKHSQKITEKLFKDFDSLAILNDIIVSYKYKTTTVSDKMSYELEFLGYIQTTIPSLSLDYAYVTNIDGKFKNKNVTLYRLQNGETEIVKVKAKTFEDNELTVGDVIKTVECSRERKWGRTPEGEYYQKDEYETILKKWIFVR